MSLLAVAYVTVSFFVSFLVHIYFFLLTCNRKVRDSHESMGSGAVACAADCIVRNIHIIQKVYLSPHVGHGRVYLLLWDQDRVRSKQGLDLLEEMQERNISLSVHIYIVIYICLHSLCIIYISFLKKKLLYPFRWMLSPNCRVCYSYADLLLVISFKTTSELNLQVMNIFQLLFLGKVNTTRCWWPKQNQENSSNTYADT